MTDLNGNSALGGLKQVNEQLATDAVVLMIQGEDGASNGNDTSNDPSTISSSANFGIKSPEVVLTPQKFDESSRIPGSSFGSKSPEVLALQKPPTRLNLGFTELDRLKSQVQLSTFSGQPSPEITNFSPGLDKPPKIPTTLTTMRPPVARSAFSKPKSRFSEPPIPAGLNPIDEKKTTLIQDGGRNSPYMASPNNKASATTPKENIKTAPITPKTPLMASPGPAGGEEDEEEEEDEDIYKSEKPPTLMESWRKKLKFWVLLEWIALVCITGILISSLTIERLERLEIWDLHLWKWCVLLLVIVCGRLFTEWFMNGLVFLIERNFLLKKKVLYFVYGLKKSVQVCIWLGLVLLSWALLFDGRIKLSSDTNKVLDYVTRALVSSLVGAGIWLLKTLLLKILAGSFHVNTFFDRIQESFYHQYVLQMLSGPPTMELAENIGYTKTPGQLSVRSVKKGKDGEGQEVIDVAKLHKLKQEKVSAWTMKLLSNVISTTKLSTISSSIEELDDEEGEQKDVEITCEWEAKAAAFRIFRNVAKPGSKYIYEDDLQRFLSKEEVANVFPLFEGAVEAGKIKKSMLRNWVVKVYLERKSLAHSLNDAQTAVKQLNKVASVIVLVMIVIVWLLLMGIATTQLLLFISSQMLLIVFVFGNTAKVVFEGIIFVFVMHPFDVGDRCVIDGVQMIVEEMNILSTVFLRYDNQKIYFPNAVLATKCIGNMYRSPFMGDAVEFAVDVSTTAESIVALKARIKMYIESKPQHWNPNHSVVVLEIENVDKMKMALYITHTMNHQNMGEKTNRRSDLVFELKKIFEELSIKYHLLPQEVLVTYAGSATTAPVTIG
ncbi:Mechanosensitive ion channel MscS [Macleaya cordata]|uniref:Mechanosensitive ion channel protein n=1 Tax=Macleaya cordata TaxID=56857 RepID=A0A200R499_MACCD|nr:Mechanosensitive ion channel MscS [Macleaya cordata]